MKLWKVGELYEMFANFFYAIGFFGEIIMIFLVCALIRHEMFYLLFYVVGIVLSSNINFLLKSYFKELRPNNPVKFLDTDNFSKSKTSTAYGMPSGHSQAVFFSIAYLWLTLHDTFLLQATSLIGISTVFERWYFHNHTLNQMFVGGIVGSLFALLTVYIRELVKEVTEKRGRIL